MRITERQLTAHIRQVIKEVKPKRKYASITEILEQVISEISIEQLQQQFVDTEKITQEVFDKIVGVTKGKGAYATWMVKRVQDNSIKEEDIYKYEEFLKTFERFKRQFPSPDINSYKGEEAVRGFEEKAIEIAEKDVENTGGDTADASKLVSSNGIEELRGVGIKLLGVVDGYQCFEVPMSARGNKKAYATYTKHLGQCAGRSQGAKINICTFANQRHFDDYLRDGPYYIFFNLSDPKSPYQFHYESRQFMDKNDKALI